MSRRPIAGLCLLTQCVNFNLYYAQAIPLTPISELLRLHSTGLYTAPNSM